MNGISEATGSNEKNDDQVRDSYQKDKYTHMMVHCIQVV